MRENRYSPQSHQLQNLPEFLAYGDFTPFAQGKCGVLSALAPGRHARIASVNFSGGPSRCFLILPPFTIRRNTIVCRVGDWHLVGGWRLWVVCCASRRAPPNPTFRHRPTMAATIAWASSPWGTPQSGAQSIHWPSWPSSWSIRWGVTAKSIVSPSPIPFRARETSPWLCTILAPSGAPRDLCDHLPHRTAARRIVLSSQPPSGRSGLWLGPSWLPILLTSPLINSIEQSGSRAAPSSSPSPPPHGWPDRALDHGSDKLFEGVEAGLSTIGRPWWPLRPPLSTSDLLEMIILF